MTLAHDSLYNYYKTNFGMMQYHKYSLTEIENMIPWEREIYIKLLKKWVEKENENNKKLAQARRQKRKR